MNIGDSVGVILFKTSQEVENLQQMNQVQYQVILDLQNKLLAAQKEVEHLKTLLQYTPIILDFKKDK